MQEMQSELKSIQGDVNITFVYVTHDQDEALTMSDRIAVFNDGRIEQVSTPFELYERPANEFVAGFVGTSNVLDRDGERFTIRPEKVAMYARGENPDGLRTEPGTVAAVGYAGMITRYTVALDAGGELQIVRQNTEESSEDLASERGREVTVGWDPGHSVPIAQSDSSPTKEEEAS